MAASDVYVFDSGPLIDMRWGFPPDLADEMLHRFATMGEAGRWISVAEVLKELRGQGDVLTAWAEQHKQLFRDPDLETQTIVTDVLQRFPKLIDPDKETPQADPFVIAEAVKRNRARNLELFPSGKVVVVAQEVAKPGNPKIPGACQFYGVPYVNLFAFLEEEGIRTGIK